MGADEIICCKLNDEEVMVSEEAELTDREAFSTTSREKKWLKLLKVSQSVSKCSLFVVLVVLRSS